MESTWDLITKKQFGFRKKYDTRIAVMNYLGKFHKLKKIHKNIHVMTIDIAKCFDSVSHRLIRESIKKFLPNHGKINDFLLHYYSGNRIGAY